MLAVLHYNFPVFSAVLLLIAGILIGYALWIPFRGDSEGIARQLDDMQDQNDDLEKALKQQRDAYIRLEKRSAEQLKEWEYLRASHERVEKTLSEQGVAKGSIEQGLAALQDLREHAIRELDIERKRRTDLEDKMNGSSDTSEQLRTSLEDYGNLQSKYEALNSDFSSLKQEYGELVGQLQELQQTSVNEDQQLSIQTESLNSEAELQIESLQRALEEQQARTETLQQERTEILTQLQNERDQRCDLEEILQVKEQELSSRVIESEELAALRVGELEQALEIADENIDQLKTERESTVVRLDQAHEQIKALTTDVDSHRRAFDAVERQRDQLALATRRENDSRRVNEQETGALRQEISQLQAEVALSHTIRQQNGSLERQYKALQESHQENQRTLAQLRAERDSNSQSLVEEREHREEIAGRIDRHLKEVDLLRQQREDVLRELREEQLLRNKAEGLLAEQTNRLGQVSREAQDVEEIREEIRSLRGQLEYARAQLNQATEEQEAAQLIANTSRETINSLQAQLAAQQQSISTLKLNGQGIQERYDNRIEQMTMERNNARASVELAEEKMAELQEQMDELHSTVADLRREREDVLARLRRQTVMLESHMARNGEVAEQPLSEEAEFVGANSFGAEEYQLASEETEELRRDERRGLVYLRRPAQVDDLKKIYGIAEVLERKLNDFGIYTYRQIMEWDEAAVDEFSQLLTFRDRIQRDQWIAQASRLYGEAYGKAA